MDKRPKPPHKLPPRPPAPPTIHTDGQRGRSRFRPTIPKNRSTNNNRLSSNNNSNNGDYRNPPASSSNGYHNSTYSSNSYCHSSYGNSYSSSSNYNARPNVEIDLSSELSNLQPPPPPSKSVLKALKLAAIPLEPLIPENSNILTKTTEHIDLTRTPPAQNTSSSPSVIVIDSPSDSAVGNRIRSPPRIRVPPAKLTRKRKPKDGTDSPATKKTRTPKKGSIDGNSPGNLAGSEPHGSSFASPANIPTLQPQVTVINASITSGRIDQRKKVGKVVATIDLTVGEADPPIAEDLTAPISTSSATSSSATLRIPLPDGPTSPVKLTSDYSASIILSNSPNDPKLFVNTSSPLITASLSPINPPIITLPTPPPPLPIMKCRSKDPWTLQEKQTVFESIKFNEILPNVPNLNAFCFSQTTNPKSASFLQHQKQLIAQTAPLLYNFVYSKVMVHESNRKGVCWGPWSSTVAASSHETNGSLNELKGASVWTLSSSPAGCLIARSDLRMFRPSSLEFLESTVAVAAGRKESLNSNYMSDFRSSFIPRDLGRFIRAFRKRNMLITSGHGDTHSIWNLSEESPFRAPAILLSAQSTPSTTMIEISSNDQLVAVAYQNGSTYVWNMENDRLGENRLMFSTNLLHPEASFLKPAQKQVVAFNFNCCSWSYPVMTIAYPDRITFVDTRTKRHIFSQIFNCHTDPLTAMHWNERDGQYVATGSSTGEVRIWDVRQVHVRTAKSNRIPVASFQHQSTSHLGTTPPCVNADGTESEAGGSTCVQKLEWSTIAKDLVLSTTSDGVVEMYNVTKQGPAFIHRLHANSRVFNSFWNTDPVHEGVVLTGFHTSVGGGGGGDEEGSADITQVWRSKAYMRERRSGSGVLGEFDLDKALKRALGGGISGAAAMVVQVFSLMPLRTVMNYQYKNGMDTTTAIKILYKDGGFVRYYRGLGPALIQGPMSRFGDTASNAGALALLESSDLTRELPMSVKTLFASAFAASFRMILTPIDTLKTTMQTSGANGTALLRQRVRVHGISTLWYGSVATAAATFVGHYPWFATYNMLQEYIPQQKTTGKKLARNAVIGFSASIVSDCISNSLRVVKTYRQTHETKVTYRQAVQDVIAKDGVVGLFGRGLKTRILTNGLQGIMFSVLWKMFEELGDLPFEIHSQIASYFRNPKHLARFTSASSQLRPLWHEAMVWKQLVTVSSPVNTQPTVPLPTTAQDLLAYYRLSSSVVKPSTMDITWLSDPRYWRIIDTVPGVTDIPQVNSVRKSAQVAHLISVCYLDVVATLPNVNTNCIYIPKVTLAVPRPFRSLENIIISAEVVGEDGEIEIFK
ncbi:UNVERIFIED_CONTAM: hypothetical protein HDU68_003325 [Siphonaria sp. JEL0065]|nr:hypothetical protein HDU68_003325 [Siphonaria sp. JEL0065]